MSRDPLFFCPPCRGSAPGVAWGRVMTPTPGTQCDAVLSYLRREGSISPREAMAFGVYRLAARIKDLREMGYPIRTNDGAHDGGTHARYVLERSEVELEAAGQTSLWA